MFSRRGLTGRELQRISFRLVAQVVALGMMLCACSTTLQTGANREFSVIAYYHGSDPREIDRYPIGKLTHVIYSFLHLDGNRLAAPTSTADGTIRHLVALKDKFPRLTIQIAVGGWGGCKTCSDVFASATGREEFVASAFALYEKYGIDGLDLDWEYPAIAGHPGHRYRPEDKQNFTALIRVLRRTMPAGFELSFAAGAHSEYLENSVEWDEVIPLVDRVHLMTYDLVNGFSPVTGHHSPLRRTSRQKNSVEHAVRYLKSLGTDSWKIVIGAAFYARVWEGVSDSTGTPLYQPGHFQETVDYKEFGKRFGDDFEYFWDTEAEAPYRYSRRKGEFATFEDPRSIALKVAYAAEQDLGGIMFWQLAGDRYQDGLLDAIEDGMQDAQR